MTKRRSENRRLAWENLASQLIVGAPLRRRLPMPVLEQAREAAGVVKAAGFTEFTDRQRTGHQQVSRALHACQHLPLDPHRGPARTQANQRLQGNLKVLHVEQERLQRRALLEDVDQISAEGDYVSLHTRCRSYLHKATMASMESQLDPDVFARVHRPSIVNLSKVGRLLRRGPRAVSLVLTSGEAVAVGPSFINTTLQTLNARRWP